MKKFFTNSAKVLLIAIATTITFLFSTSDIKAQNGDYKFYAKYDVSTSMIHFQWYLNTNADVNTTFVMYMAQGEHKIFDADSFMELCKTNPAESRTNSGGYYYKYEFKLDVTSNYSFCLVTIYPNGQVANSNVFIMYNTNTDPDYSLLKFSEFPSNRAYLNKEYKSNIKAVSSKNDIQISYKLLYGPDGMKIDSETGEISWTPQNTNVAKVSIQAYTNQNTTVTLTHTFEIYVYSCDTPGKIVGKIAGSDGTPITKGFITVFSIKDSQNSNYKKYTTEVIDGFFFIEVDAGMYNLAFMDENGQLYYYNTPNSATDIKGIEVDCGQSVTISWQLQKASLDKTFMVSGRVFDFEGNPVPNWTVFFQNVDNDNQNGYTKTFQAITNKEGVYTIDLPADNAYIAYIMLPQDPDKNYFAPTYLYYNQTLDRTLATTIKLPNDLKGIDFKFINQDVDYKSVVVHGYAIDEANNPLPNVVVVFEGFNDKSMSAKDFRYYFKAVTNEKGYYEIKLPVIYKYIAYAIRTSNSSNIKDSYMPLYYKQTYNRDEATIISLEKDISNYDFIFKVMDNDYNIFISGIVIDEEYNPIGNAFVEAINVSTDAAGFNKNCMYTYSNDKGEFTIKGLVPGKYLLFASTQGQKDFYCGYYVENDIATINYDKATVLTIEKNTDRYYKIILPKFTNSDDGKGIVKGKIYNNSNYSINNASEAAITTAKIYCNTMSNNQKSLNSFNESNADGSFQISGLQDGEYNFVIEKVGFYPFEINLVITDGSSIDLGNIMLIPLSTSITDKYATAEVYPNPVSNLLTLEFVSSTENVNISFYNTNGDLITSTVQTVNVGNNLINLNVNYLLNGQYLIVIDDSKVKFLSQIIIAR
ncbi:MAG: hypothetical protein A2X64_06400 [Ignavibacteria bacterium GWF2_33_9]|nr:MAG: hypothetical protein A2X64_06400 [Ignavibacteria bacterium GWF2_33_9]